jgi:hypothetical protein
VCGNQKVGEMGKLRQRKIFGTPLQIDIRQGGDIRKYVPERIAQGFTPLAKHPADHCAEENFIRNRKPRGREHSQVDQ